MGTTAIPRRKLEDADACWLVEADGTQWRVMDVVFDDGIAWVQARAAREESGKAVTPRVFETVVTSGAYLIWELPNGSRVLARSGPSGELRWDPDLTGASRESLDVLDNEFLAS